MKTYLTSRPVKILLVAKIISTLAIVSFLSGCEYSVKVKDLTGNGGEKNFNVKVMEEGKENNDAIKTIAPNRSSFSYNNAQYGFSLTLPNEWQGLLSSNRTLNWGEAGTSDSIDFGLPAQNELFNISVHTKEQWKNFAGEEGSMPVKSAENDKYVFGWAQAQYTANAEMEKRYAEIPAIIETFKLNSNLIKTEDQEKKEEENLAPYTEAEISWNEPVLDTTLDFFEKDDPATKQETKYYRVGTVQKGKHEGGLVMLISHSCMGPCFYPDFIR